MDLTSFFPPYDNTNRIQIEFSQLTNIIPVPKPKPEIDMKLLDRVIAHSKTNQI